MAIALQLLDVAGAALFVLAAIQDLSWRMVPNVVPMAIASVGLTCRGLDGSLSWGLLAAATVFAAAAACWRRGWLGGADVKLFGAGALLVPPASVADFVLCTALAGGILGAGYWAVGRAIGDPAPVRPAGTLPRLLRVERRRLRRGGPLPYAVALTAGIVVILATP